MRLSSVSRGEKVLLLLFLFFGFVVPECLMAQQEIAGSQPILFRGVVVDAVTQEPVEGVQYFSDRQAATDANGLFSFYAHIHDTIIFECKGYRETLFLVSDTLKAREYTMGLFLNPDTLFISEVVVIPRLGDLKTFMMTDTPVRSAEEMNATNNLKLSAYQSIAGMDQLGNPDANYQLLKQQQKTNAFEKGGIPSDKMVNFSLFSIIPVIYTLMRGLPETPAPPAPYLSSKELGELRDIYKKISGNEK